LANIDHKRLYFGLQRVSLYLVVLCAAKFWGGGHNIHYDINPEGTPGVKKNLIPKTKKFGKGGA